MEYELKFRLKRKGKVVGYEWHKFFDGQMRIFHSKENLQFVDMWADILHWASLNEENMIIEHDTKEQFTGVMANMGEVEIYQGDKIEATSLISDLKVRGTVFLAGGMFGIGKKRSETDFSMDPLFHLGGIRIINDDHKRVQRKK
jgi:hypothetical protein